MNGRLGARVIFAALLLAPTLAWGQQLGVSVTVSHGRTPPLSRSPLDKQTGMSLGIAWRPGARVGAELRMEVMQGPFTYRGVGPRGVRVDLATAARASATLSAAWRHKAGPVGVTVLPGIGAQYVEFSVYGPPAALAPHAGLAIRADLQPARWLRLFAEASASYLRLSSRSERGISAWQAQREPCSRECIVPFRDAWTTTGRIGLMLLAF